MTKLLASVAIIAALSGAPAAFAANNTMAANTMAPAKKMKKMKKAKAPAANAMTAAPK
jgi:hypothetical protein